MIKSTSISGLYLISPRIFKDDRGYFMETYNNRQFENQGLNYSWVQDNESKSDFGTLRGLHYQTGIHAQAKLVRVAVGKVLDVVVDLRHDSPTFGKHFSEILSEENKNQLLIPRGFAHGFIVLSDFAIFQYKCDNFYNKESEGSINAFDPNLGIDWIISHKNILRSDKDKLAPLLVDHKPTEI